MGKMINFAHVNAQADFTKILNHYNLEYTQKGDQIRLRCPFHDDTKPSCSITLVETDGRCRHVATELDFPNGLLITDGGRTLVVAESFGHRVSAFDIADDGSLDARRVLCELPDLVPDGICLDAEGNVWVAGAMGGAFVQVAPDGSVIARIDVAPRAAIACQLGGSDGHSLYCLTYDGGVEELSRGEPGAHIEVARVDIPAAGSP